MHKLLLVILLLLTSHISLADEDLMKDIEKEVGKLGEGNKLFKDMVDKTRSGKSLSAKEVLKNIQNNNKPNQNSMLGQGNLANSMKRLFEPYQKMPHFDVYEVIKKNLEKGRAKVLLHIPKIVDFFTHFVRSPNAPYELGRILDQREKLAKFGGMNLVVIIFSLVFGKFYVGAAKGFISNVSRRIFKFCLINSMRVGLIIYFYSVELTPLTKIFKKIYLS